jgi:glycosyltransferase involved in cell wall biosynthesis
VLPAAAGDRAIFSPANTAPIAARRSAVVIHDLSIIRHPEWSSAGGRLFGRLMELSARRASLVIVPSSVVAAHVEALGVNPDAIEVVHWAHDPDLKPASAARIREVLTRLEVSRPYILFVGWHSPRKNAQMLVRAHVLALHRVPHALVLVGPPNPGFANAHIRPRDSVKLLDYVDESSLTALLTGASALVYPTSDEGFGLPPHEAAAVATPALVSDIPVLHETAPKGVRFLPTHDVSAWADAIVDAVEGRTASPVPLARTWEDIATQSVEALGQHDLLDWTLSPRAKKH